MFCLMRVAVTFLLLGSAMSRLGDRNEETQERKFKGATSLTTSMSNLISRIPMLRSVFGLQTEATLPSILGAAEITELASLVSFDDSSKAGGFNAQPYGIISFGATAISARAYAKGNIVCVGAFGSSASSSVWGNIDSVGTVDIGAKGKLYGSVTSQAAFTSGAQSVIMGPDSTNDNPKPSVIKCNGAATFGASSRLVGEINTIAAVNIGANSAGWDDTPIIRGDIYSLGGVTIGAAATMFGEIQEASAITLAGAATLTTPDGINDWTVGMASSGDDTGDEFVTKGVTFYNTNNKVLPSAKTISPSESSKAIAVLSERFVDFVNFGRAASANGDGAYLVGQLLPSITAGPTTPLTLAPGSYHVNGALALALNTVLRFNGNQDDVWVIRVAGAAIFSGNMELVNGALAQNIVWVVGGAVATAAGTQSYGKILCKGAISVGAGASHDGGLYSIAGAVAIGAGASFNVDVGAI